MLSKKDAETLLRAAIEANPDGTALFCYQDVADALSAAPDTAMPNPAFARSDKDFDGRPVFVFKRAGTLCHCSTPEAMHLGWDTAKKRPAQGHRPL